MSRHSMIATLGPALAAQQLAELKRLATEANAEVVDAQMAIDRLSFPTPPEEPMMLSGRPGTNRHARRARAALARRK